MLTMLSVLMQVPTHCASGQMQTVTVIDPAPGTASGLMAVS